MKFFAQCFFLSFILTAMLGIVAFAFEKDITFSRDFTIAGTVVKKGTYKVKYDAKTSELTILKGKEVIVKTRATAEQLAATSRQEQLGYRENGGTAELKTITLAGSKERIVVQSADLAAPNQ
jgi:hypothetical protein